MIHITLNYNEKQVESKESFVDCRCLFCRKDFKRKRALLLVSLSRGPNLFCSKSCVSSFSKRGQNILCGNCGESFYKTRKEISDKNYCSRSCAAIKNNSFYPKARLQKVILIGQRVGLLKKRRSRFDPQWREKRASSKDCIVCGKLFFSHKKTCSDDCFRNSLSRAGKKSAEIQSSSRRSKNEIYFYDLCIDKFDLVQNNLPIFNGWDADIILPEYKIAILWNGKWHYEKITGKHSVAQVQNRDKIKIKEIIKSGYTPYIIKDMGKYKPEFVQKEFEKFLRFLES